MSLIEPDFRAELAAHYSAVHARLWGRPVPVPPSKEQPKLIEQKLPCSPAALPGEEVAARRREIDMLFGGRVSSQSIICVTAAYFRIEVRLLTSPCRAAGILRARQCAMYIMRELCHCTVLHHGMISLNLIAKHFGRHHSSVIYAIKRVREEMKNDPVFAAEVAHLINLLTREVPVDPIITDEPR